jgi:hypothetical protein
MLQSVNALSSSDGGAGFKQVKNDNDVQFSNTRPLIEVTCDGIVMSASAVLL